MLTSSFQLSVKKWAFRATAFLVLICSDLRALQICYMIPDNFARIMGISLIGLISTQMFINIGVATGLLPITGMTLPFISYGGSSLISSCIIAGILLNISRFKVVNTQNCLKLN